MTTQRERPTRRHAWIEWSASIIGRPRTMAIVIAVEASWIAINLTLGDAALDRAPSPVLGRTSAGVACVLLALPWANGRRIARRVRRKSAGTTIGVAEYELETMLRASNWRARWPHESKQVGSLDRSRRRGEGVH